MQALIPRTLVAGVGPPTGGPGEKLVGAVPGREAKVPTNAEGRVACRSFRGAPGALRARSSLARLVAAAALLPLSGLLHPEVSFAWRSTLSSPGAARALAVAGDGGVVASGETLGPSSTMFTVARFHAPDGTILWSRQVAPGASTGVLVDELGDVIAGGFLGEKDGVGIVKLDRASGAETWRFRIPRAVTLHGRGVAMGMALNGDALLAVGRSRPGGAEPRAIAYRLAKSSGAIVWKRNLGRRIAIDLATDSRADVLVGAVETSQDPVKIFKLERSTGSILWSSASGLRGQDLQLVVSSTDRVLAVGRTETNGPITVVAMGKDDGREIWRRTIGAGGAFEAAPSPDGGLAVAIDPSPSPIGVRLLHIAGEDGSFTWDRLLDTGAGSSCGVTDLFVSSSGDPILGGCSLAPDAGRFRMQLAAFAGNTGRLRWRRGIESSLEATAGLASPVVAIAGDQEGNLAAAGSGPDEAARPAFTVVKWNDERGDDLLLPSERDCRSVIVKQASNYVFTRLQLVESCRDGVNAGVDSGGFESCEAGGPLARLAKRTRDAIRAACPGDFLPPGVSCGRTVAELLDAPYPAGPAGCLMQVDDRVVTMIADTAYSTPLVGTPTASQRCQAAVGTAGRRIFDAVLGAAQDCRRSGAIDLSECEGRESFERPVRDVAMAQRGRISGACTVDQLRAIGSCAGTLDAMISPQGDSGCLVSASRRGALDASEAHD